MALARFKDLCIDANDAVTLGGFWSAVLGLELQRYEDGMVVLRGPTSQHTIWLDTVPEPRTVKQRVHLDVNAASVDEVVAAGATVLDADSFPWTVLADPEGGELCVFVREPPVTQRLYEIVVDTADSAEASAGIARWWAQLLGASVVHDDRGFSYVHQIPGAPFDSFDFIPVPEAKAVKNRIHWDVDTDDVSALVAAGRPSCDRVSRRSPGRCSPTLTATSSARSPTETTHRAAVRVWRWTARPRVPQECRHDPTCSGSVRRRRRPHRRADRHRVGQLEREDHRGRRAGRPRRH